MRSGYAPRLSDDGKHMLFAHRTKEPFTLPTGPNLTLGDAWATIASRVDMAEFVEHWQPNETFTEPPPGSPAG